MSIIESAGIFIYPLALCYIIATYLILERLIALRKRRVLPIRISEKIVSDSFKELLNCEDESSVGGRIIAFYKTQGNDTPEALKAYARYEVSCLERGLFMLEIIVSAAPLIGLLGTVVGLIKVFSNMAGEGGLPEPSVLVQGISLALTTTMLGLFIAIPALAGNSFLQRRLQKFTVGLDVLIERLCDFSKNK